MAITIKKEENAVKFLLEIFHDRDKWEDLSDYCKLKAGYFSEESLIQRWNLLISLVLDNENPEYLLQQNQLACENQLSNLEYDGIIKEYEKIVDEVAQRINRADAAQDFLHENWQNERRINQNPSFRYLIKNFIKKIFRIHR
jgi:hypothetical protein